MIKLAPCTVTNVWRKTAPTHREKKKKCIIYSYSGDTCFVPDLPYYRKNHVKSIRNTEMMLTSGQNTVESVLDDEAVLLRKQVVKFQSPTWEAHSYAVDVMRLVRNPLTSGHYWHLSWHNCMSSTHPDPLHVYGSFNYLKSPCALLN
jgi:hypothetical protein